MVCNRNNAEWKAGESEMTDKNPSIDEILKNFTGECRCEISNLKEHATYTRKTCPLHGISLAEQHRINWMKTKDKSND